METPVSACRNRLDHEINLIPPEYWAQLTQIVHVFRETLTLKTAQESLAQGWREAQGGEERPVEELWETIDAE
jgi:hypothetical protein